MRMRTQELSPQLDTGRALNEGAELSSAFAIR
jgi:hypothetical protein